MERLTNKNHKEIGFCAYVGAQNPFIKPLSVVELAGFLNVDYSPRKILEDVFDRLAAYEDTGLNPEEVTAIKNALMGRETAKITEFDGIPVKRLRELAQAEKDGRLVVLQDGITVHDLQNEYCNARHMADERLPSPSYITGHIAGFGEGVIHILDKVLTREEAEAALKKREAAT